jgi:hypothetical protein
MTELEKIKRQAQRVIKAFRGVFKMKDILDVAKEFKDTLEKACTEKLAGITPQALIELIVARAKYLQTELSGLSTTMQKERELNNKNTTLTILNSLKKALLEIKQLSLGLPVEIHQKAGAVLSSLRNKIEDNLKEIQGFIDEVKGW